MDRDAATSFIRAIPTPPWMPAEEFEQCRQRLYAIEDELCCLGATPEYCLAYFQSGGGVCERVIGRQCVRHRTCAPPLPDGAMCSVEYGQAAGLLRQQVLAVEAERVRYRVEWDALKEEQTGLRFLADAGARQASLPPFFIVLPCLRAPDRSSGQEAIEERKQLIQNRLRHLFKELRDLMGERLVLLQCFRPVDTAVFHERVMSLLTEKIGLLERCKLGAALAQEQEARQ
jgi:hypothetical protein